jgi:hypothetical protein
MNLFENENFAVTFDTSTLTVATHPPAWLDTREPQLPGEREPAREILER